MTQEAFIKVLKKKGYSYKIEGDKLVVRNEGDVYLNALTSLLPDVKFRNGGDVYLYALTSLPPGVVFRNEGDVYLNALTSLLPDVKFRNGGDVYLDALIGGSIPYGWFKKWKGNIEGIDSKRLLNFMISKGIFER